jgi:S1-C subfamily serine protease
VHLVAENERSGSGTIVGRTLDYPSGDVAIGLSCSAAGRTAAVDDAGGFEIADVTSGRLVVDCRSSSTSLTGPMSAGEVLTNVDDGTVVEVTVHVVSFDTDRMGHIGARLTHALSSSPEAASFTAIDADGAAAMAGVVEGDVLVTVDGAPAQGEYRQAATSYIHTRPAGQTITLRVWRPGDDATFDIALVSSP